MTNENEKVINHNKIFGFSFKLQKQIIYQIINSNLWIEKRSCNEQYMLKRWKN